VGWGEEQRVQERREGVREGGRKEGGREGGSAAWCVKAMWERLACVCREVRPNSQFPSPKP